MFCFVDTVSTFETKRESRAEIVLWVILMWQHLCYNLCFLLTVSSVVLTVIPSLASSAKFANNLFCAQVIKEYFN